MMKAAANFILSRLFFSVSNAAIVTLNGLDDRKAVPSSIETRK